MQRRKLLKNVAAFGGMTALPSVAGATQVETTDQTVNDSWEENNLFEDALDNSNPDKIDLGTSLVWYNVDWDDSNDAWEHEFALSNTVAGLSHDGNKKWVIGANEWKVDVDTSWDLDMQRETDKHGAMPSSNGDIVPDWLEVPVDFAFGSWSSGAGALFTVDDFFEALEPLSGMASYTSGGRMGRKFNHHPAWYNPGWAKSSLLQHFEVQHPETTYSDMTVTLEATYGANLQTHGWVQYDVSFDNVYEWESDTPSPSVSISTGTGEKIS